MKKQKSIAIFFGGHSAEYEVSLQSAYAVISGIDTQTYAPVLIGIARETGSWYRYQGNPERIREDRWLSQDVCTPVFPSFDRREPGLCCLDKGCIRMIRPDGALLLLHGKNGEDGTVQGVIELMGIPLIGCGVLSSALCMDKELAHRIVREKGINVARSHLLGRDDDEEMMKRKARELGYPLFVKPVCSGSSFGISKVAREQELAAAVETAFLYDSAVMLEETIDGFEVGCAILGNADSDLIVGEVDEIELSGGFFDYTEKYTLKTSAICVPARISPQTAAMVKETALVIYRALHCSCFARVDMFLTPAGEIYFNEVNTIPGFTEHSRYPNMLKAAGMTFEEIVSRLIETGWSE